MGVGLEPVKIYGNAGSGNCLKVKWTADMLGLPYTWREVDSLNGETRTPAYLAKFPMGQVPGVEFADGRRLAQSNAIMRYLARGSALLPEDPFLAAQMDEWLFWEQYSHEPYIAVCRSQMVYRGISREDREPWRVERGEAALDVMERHLTGRDWLAGEGMTVADIALLAYSRVAHEGGFDLASRPALRAWVARGETQLNLALAA
jgi:glutathione S-transferase